MSAHRESDEIISEREGMGFVEIVNAPDQATLDVAPGAEVLHVQIADCQHLRGPGKFWTDLRPHLRPAVVSRAQERENSCLHVVVFELQVFLNDRGTAAQPIFEVAGSFHYVHSANDSGWIGRKSTAWRRRFRSFGVSGFRDFSVSMWCEVRLSTLFAVRTLTRPPEAGLGWFSIRASVRRCAAQAVGTPGSPRVLANFTS